MAASGGAGIAAGGWGAIVAPAAVCFAAGFGQAWSVKSRSLLVVRFEMFPWTVEVW